MFGFRRCRAVAFAAIALLAACDTPRTRQVAAGAISPEDATLRFLDFKTTLQQQVAQRRAAANAEQWNRLQMLNAINTAPRLQRGPTTISCFDDGIYINCTDR